MSDLKVQLLEKAFKLVRNAAAGLTNHCEDNGSTRRFSKELQEADRVYREIALIATSAIPDNKEDGCTCQGCGDVYTADLIVPDGWWEKIKPVGKAEGAGLLCPTCIMERLVEKGWGAGYLNPTSDHIGDGNKMVRVLFDLANQIADEGAVYFANSIWGEHHVPGIRAAAQFIAAQGQEDAE